MKLEDIPLLSRVTVSGPAETTVEGIVIGKEQREITIKGETIRGKIKPETTTQEVITVIGESYTEKGGTKQKITPDDLALFEIANPLVPVKHPAKKVLKNTGNSFFPTSILNPPFSVHQVGR